MTRSPLRLILPASALALSAALLGACGGDDGSEDSSELIEPAPYSAEPTPDGESSAEAGTTPTSEQPATPEEEAVPDGQLISWDDYDADRAAYAEGTVVLYFHAPWCHECQATDEAISKTGIPPGLTLVQIDYDSRTDLRQDYGVTIQHSFVLVDDAGERQDIWTDTISGAEIADRAA